MFRYTYVLAPWATQWYWVYLLMFSHVSIIIEKPRDMRANLSV